jgi:hypothetical protein
LELEENWKAERQKSEARQAKSKKSRRRAQARNGRQAIKPMALAEKAKRKAKEKEALAPLGGKALLASESLGEDLTYGQGNS